MALHVGHSLTSTCRTLSLVRGIRTERWAYLAVTRSPQCGQIADTVSPAFHGASMTPPTNGTLSMVLPVTPAVLQALTPEVRQRLHGSLCTSLLHPSLYRTGSSTKGFTTRSQPRSRP